MKFEITDHLNIRGIKSLYVSRNKEPKISNAYIRTVALPSPFSALIGRILHFIWLVNHYISTNNSDEIIEINAANGRKLIRISLANGEIVSFKVKYLIAWTKPVEISTKINLSIVHLATKMMLIQRAVGPGELIFEVSGSPVEIGNQSGQFPADRLVTWEDSCVFDVRGAYSFLDLYLNSPLVSINNEASTGILDSDDHVRRGPAALWSMIKRFYIP